MRKENCRRRQLCKEFLIVRQEGKRQVSRAVEHYNLDAIISVGYRVKSAVATRFRIWATQRLREFIVKGSLLDDERLKNPPGPEATDYFDEILERIRDIRSSERRMHLRVKEILALATDYEPEDRDTQVFSRRCRTSFISPPAAKPRPN